MVPRRLFYFSPRQQKTSAWWEAHTEKPAMKNINTWSTTRDGQHRYHLEVEHLHLRQRRPSACPARQKDQIEVGVHSGGRVTARCRGRDFLCLGFPICLQKEGEGCNPYCCQSILSITEDNIWKHPALFLTLNRHQINSTFFPLHKERTLNQATVTAHHKILPWILLCWSRLAPLWITSLSPTNIATYNYTTLYFTVIISLALTTALWGRQIVNCLWVSGKWDAGRLNDLL